jgi:hypothetical protein
MIIKLVIGFTESDRANDYVSFTDGWRPDAAQRVEEVTIDFGDHSEIAAMPDVQWCEAVFVATNAPTLQIINDKPGAGEIHLQLSHRRVRSLSVGDTVTVIKGAMPGRTYECVRDGWHETEPGQEPDR